MREQLIRYIDLLFAGAPHASDIKQEIMQNTLDRYDDLVCQGKTSEAAYSLAISGIGDINELFTSIVPVSDPAQSAPQTEPEDTEKAKKYRAICIAMYILSPVPLFILSDFGLDTMGLCYTLLLIAAATFGMVRYGKKEPNHPKEEVVYTPQQELRHSIRKIIHTIGLVAYFAISLLTQAWYITWVIFPLTAAVRGLVFACMDLKEAVEHEI